MIKIRFLFLTILLYATASTAQTSHEAQSASSDHKCLLDEYDHYFDNLYGDQYKKRNEKKETLDSLARGEQEWLFKARHQATKCSQILPIEGGVTVGDIKPIPQNSDCAGTIVLEEKTVKSTKNLTNRNGDGSSVVWAAPSVGRLEIQVKGTDMADGYYSWGTGFVVGQRTEKDGTYALVATTCHAIEPLSELVDKKWHLKKLDYSKLLVGYGDRTEYQYQEVQDQVTDLVAYPDDAGLDVAFLRVRVASASRQILRLDEQTRDFKPTTRIFVIGYPDFHHPLDPLIGESYGPFVTYGAAKFLSSGRIGLKGECSKDKGLLWHDASTTMGESGGPVILDPSSQTAIGVHICCSAYWNEERGTPPYPTPGMDCARTYRQSSNKTVSSHDIICNQPLRDALNYYNVGHEYSCPDK